MSKYTTLIKKYCIAVDKENEQTTKDNEKICEYNNIKSEVDRLLEIECVTKLTHNARRVKLLILSEELNLTFIPAIKIYDKRVDWMNPKPRPTRDVIKEIEEQFMLDDINQEEHIEVSELIFLADNGIIDYELYQKVINGETTRRANADEFRDMACYYGKDSDNILRKKYQLFDNPPPLINEVEMSTDIFHMNKKPSIPKGFLTKQ